MKQVTNKIVKHPSRNLPTAKYKGYAIERIERVVETPKNCGTKWYFKFTLKRIK